MTTKATNPKTSKTNLSRKAKKLRFKGSTAPLFIAPGVPIYSRSHSKKIHKFSKQREYVRAINATKMERLFAKPFVANLNDHNDTPTVIDVSPTNLRCFVSADAEGTIIVWDLALRKSLWSAPRVHLPGGVRGLSILPRGDSMLSAGLDSTIKYWNLKFDEALGGSDALLPIRTWTDDYAFSSVSSAYSSNIFASSGETVKIWNVNSLAPIMQYKNGPHTSSKVKFHPIRHHIVAALGSDRSFIIYDTRVKTPVSKTVRKARNNDLSWNPQDENVIVLASDDHNCYSFDIRNLEKATQYHTGHENAVMSVDWSPTGLEFATGSYDKTIRIFKKGSGRSREVYYHARQQIVNCVKYSLDSHYIISASDDANIRIWKTQRADFIGTLSARERAKKKYDEHLREKFSSFPEVQRIAKFRKVPKGITIDKKRKKIMLDSRKKKGHDVSIKPSVSTTYFDSDEEESDSSDNDE